jgi:hypothetical protein
MQSFGVLNQVVHIVTSGVSRINCSSYWKRYGLRDGKALRWEEGKGLGRGFCYGLRLEVKQGLYCVL